MIQKLVPVPDLTIHEIIDYRVKLSSHVGFFCCSKMLEKMCSTEARLDFTFSAAVKSMYLFTCNGVKRGTNVCVFVFQ